MAPIKLEENIREKLQERELQPSKDAWTKLEAQLDEDKDSNKKVIWYAIAASIATLLIVGALVFNPSEKSNTTIVNKDTKVETLEAQPSPIVVQDVFKEAIASEEVEIPTTTLKEQMEQPKQITQASKQIVNSSFIKNKTIAIKEEKTFEEQKSLKKVEPIDFVNLKINEVVTQVKNNAEITPEEVDALLIKAQKEIQTQRILNESATKVDAMALLKDVENDLEQSFRDRVFEALGQGFKKVRTAVAERNN